MASSGTYNFNLSVGESVLAAYERAGVRPTSIRAEHMVTARREANLLLVEAANRQVNLWKVELITTALTASDAEYNVPARVVMILDAWISTTQGGNTNNRYITPMSRTDYASLSNPESEGPPTQYWFNRLIAPTITMWPVPDQSATYELNYYAVVQMQDANLAGGETPDLPYLWLDWFVAGLAHRFARIYAPPRVLELKADAKEAWEIAAAQNVENVNVSLAPPLSRYYR